MDQHSRLSLENHPVIVDLRTARAENSALLKRTALEQKQRLKKEKEESSAGGGAAGTGTGQTKNDAHGIGFSVARLVGGHTGKEPAPAPDLAESLAGAGFF